VDVDAIATRVALVERAPTLRSIDVPEGARVLMMAGRVIAAKRFDNFVRIAAEVARRQKDREVHALVVGDGPDLDDVRRVAAKEGAPARIHFLGYQRDLLPFLAASDVVVFPSEHPEVLPMFLIETSAAARPIVCSDVPGNREIVTDGETGCVARGGVAGYATAVIDLLQHPERGALYAHAAQRRAQERFDRPAVTRETIAVYRNLLAAK
jgi:glycosyltransferase involved in cell wall biosynthesis